MPRKKKKIKKKTGRPTNGSKATDIAKQEAKDSPEGKLGKETVKALEEAFSIDSSIEEACEYAGITRQTYYNWIKKFPVLLDRFEGLRTKAPLKARNIIMGALDKKDVDTAKWYLERKRKKEFSTRQEFITPEDMKDPDPETKAKIDKIFSQNIKGKRKK